MPLRDLLATYGKSGILPDIAGQYTGRKIVVCGDAACVWDDLEAFGCRSDVGRGKVHKDGWDFMTVNKLVDIFPGCIEHAYSNEPNLLNAFINARRQEYRREFGDPKHTHSITKGAKWQWHFSGHGTSGLGAVLVAIGLGYERIVLCGMPLDNGRHNGEPHWRRCNFVNSEANSPPKQEIVTDSGAVVPAPNQHWQKAIDLAFRRKVKSMSGRTREWLGYP